MGTFFDPLQVNRQQFFPLFPKFDKLIFGKLYVLKIAQSDIEFIIGFLLCPQTITGEIRRAGYDLATCVFVKASRKENINFGMKLFCAMDTDLNLPVDNIFKKLDDPIFHLF